MTPALTIITTCKPFRGDAERTQRNALESWVRLEPRPEVIVFGDEPGVADVCVELGVRNVPEVERSAAGTPLLSGMLQAAEREASADWIALVNADIMLTSGLQRALEHAVRRFPRWLLIARRLNMDLHEAWDFEPSDWEERLKRRANAQGVLEPAFGGVDVFAFPRGAWGDELLPPFAIGRGRWDSGIIYQARRRGLPVVDATAVALNVHQNHDYSHHPHRIAGVFKGPEAVRNEALLGGDAFILSALDATHVMDERGIRRNVVLQPMLAVRKLGTLPARVPAFRSFAPLVTSVAPAWRRGRSVANRLRARWAAGLSGGRPTPYPSTIRSRPRYGTDVPPGGDATDFDKPDATALNRARLDHLATLGLSLEGRAVLDVGSGPGHMARFFADRHCRVTCIDGRPENVARMKELYPDLEGRVFDVECDDWSTLGRFEVVFCYGLLYHLENPFRALRQMASVCDDLLLLSTMVADHELPFAVMEEETAAYTQALRSVGCRPTPSLVALALRNAGFEHVYAPKEPPQHPDFRFAWRNDLASHRDGHPLRCVFIAARRPLGSPALASLLLPTA